MIGTFQVKVIDDDGVDNTLILDWLNGFELEFSVTGQDSEEHEVIVVFRRWKDA